MAKMRYDVESLMTLERSLANCKLFRARVGIIGQKDRKGGETNAEVGARQEFGFKISGGAFKGARVPARSFLRMPFRTHIQDVLKGMSSRVQLLIKGGGVRPFFTALGISGEKLVDKAFQTSGWGSWAPNSPITRSLKRSDRPLIDKGFLRRSISSVTVKVK